MSLFYPHNSVVLWFFCFKVDTREERTSKIVHIQNDEHHVSCVQASLFVTVTEKHASELCWNCKNIYLQRIIFNLFGIFAVCIDWLLDRDLIPLSFFCSSDVSAPDAEAKAHSVVLWPHNLCSLWPHRDWLLRRRSVLPRAHCLYQEERGTVSISYFLCVENGGYKRRNNNCTLKVPAVLIFHAAHGAGTFWPFDAKNRWKVAILWQQS